MREVIASQGWFVQHVEKDRWRPPFSYSVGLTTIGHPEVLVTGLAPQTAAHLLNTIAHGLVAHDAPAYVAGDFHVPMVTGGQFVILLDFMRTLCRQRGVRALPRHRGSSTCASGPDEEHGAGDDPNESLAGGESPTLAVLRSE